MTLGDIGYLKFSWKNLEVNCSYLNSPGLAEMVTHLYGPSGDWGSYFFFKQVSQTLLMLLHWETQLHIQILKLTSRVSPSNSQGISQGSWCYCLRNTSSHSDPENQHLKYHLLTAKTTAKVQGSFLTPNANIKLSSLIISHLLKP